MFRISCPGGSYPASDTIWREVLRAREAGKPVIVSMGNYATSGGYFMALPADKIVAEPGTITASIGVLGGKMVNREMFGKIGMTFDEVHTSQNSTMWTGLTGYTPEERQRLNDWLDRVYADFTGKVAADRDLDLEHVQEIARGRVWTGETALELGLVDELGGFSTAVRLAKEAAGLDPDDDVRLRIFPRKKSAFELFFAEPGSEASAAALQRTLQQIQPYGRLAQRTLLGPAPYGVLSTPPIDQPD